MPETKRPILIQIPEELKLTDNEISTLEHVFRVQLALIEAPGDLEPIPAKPINTTKLPVKVEVVGSPLRKVSKKSSAKARAKTKK